jgi:hypothetical protein
MRRFLVARIGGMVPIQITHNGPAVLVHTVVACGDLVETSPSIEEVDPDFAALEYSARMGGSFSSGEAIDFCDTVGLGRPPSGSVATSGKRQDPPLFS